MLRHPQRPIVARCLMAVGLLAAALATTNSSTSPVNAAAQFTTARVFYQPYASTKWGVWSGNTCPGDARYSVNYGCVYANSVSSHSTLRYTNLDGTGTTDIHISCSTGVNPHWQAPWNGVNKILVDEINGKLYWENSFEPGIARANLDGTGCELVGDGGYYSKGMVALDSTATYMYSIQNNSVRRVKLSDGTVTPLTFTGQGITVTGLGDMVVHNGKLYVAISNSGSAGHIMEATIDNATTTQTARLIVTSQPTGINGLDIDAVNNKIYWATGSAVKRANLDGTSIETVYSGSVNFVQVLPAESKILMGAAGDNNMFTTNLSGGNVTSLNVKSGSYVSAVEANVVPATTVPATTVPATTVPATTVPATTVAPVPTSVATTTIAVATTSPTSSTSSFPTTSVAGSTNPVGITRTVSSSPSATTSTVASGLKSAPSSSSSSTSTTTTTTTTAPAAPEVKGGEGKVLIDGEETQVQVLRENNKFIVKAGTISATLTGLTASGEVAPLDENGSVRLSDADMFDVDTDGFSESSNVEVWMYSTPQKLGTMKVDGQGQAAQRFAVPTDVTEGMHKVVLRGQNSAGKDVEIVFGIYVGFSSGTSTLTKTLIAVPIALAILLGLLLPTALRRRRKEETA